MTALAGLWRFDGPDPAADGARMLAAQEIYGPHDGRQWSEGVLTLGRRLFRTLPEDAFDRQPLESRDGRLVLVADVRLAASEELAAALNVTASEARTMCDAALLLEALDQWGEGALDRIVGDFAFALFDRKARRLLLARDFHGARPLHYHCGRGFFAFASMPKGLHALADVPHAPDEQVVAEFLALLPQRGPATFFKDIARVEPGHVVTVTANGLSVRRYWQPKGPGGARLSASDYVEGLRHHLDQAVRAALRGSGVTVGAHLSAGLDSAGVAATAARLLAPENGKVIAFTAVPRAGYDGAAPGQGIADEGPLAGATAALYPNIEHVLIRAGHISPLDGLDRYFFLCERPLLNLCNGVWMQAIHRAARERRIAVMLTGQMGNLTLSYSGFELLPELLRAGRLRRLWHEASRLVAKTGMRPRGALAQTFGPFVPASLWAVANSRIAGRRRDVFDFSAIRPDSLTSRNLSEIARRRGFDFAGRPWKDGLAVRLWAMDRVDPGPVNKGILAGWGIDQRDPTADRRLVEFCLSIPTGEYLRDGVPRALARRALADRLPQAVVSQIAKGYQAADWHEGATAARAEIAAELDRLAGCTPAAELIDLTRVRRLVENWPSNGWDRADIRRAYRLALLRGLSVGHFLRRAAGANR